MANEIFFDRKNNTVKVKMVQFREDFENFEKIIEVIDSLSISRIGERKTVLQTLTK